MLLQLLRVASASQFLEEGNTPGRHCADEDGRVEASTTLESQCSHLHTERCTVTSGFYRGGGGRGKAPPPPQIHQFPPKLLVKS